MPSPRQEKWPWERSSTLSSRSFKVLQSKSLLLLKSSIFFGETDVILQPALYGKSSLPMDILPAVVQSFQPQPLLSTFTSWLFISPPNPHTCLAVSRLVLSSFSTSELPPFHRSSPKQHQLLHFTSSFLMHINKPFTPFPNISTTA